MARTISSSGKEELDKMIDAATADPHKIPGCVFAVVDKAGKTIYAHASGTRGLESKQPMTLDTVFWIASCTKMIGGIAAMQLVEQGKLSLDDGDQIEKICPELKAVKLLKGVDEHGVPEYVEKQTKITLRMLLTHTAGFGYTFFNNKLRRAGQPGGFDEFSGLPHDVHDQPLVNEPGSRWEYSIGIDWAGNIVERVSGMSLNDYFHKNIFEPLGLKNISMFPHSEMKKQLAHMHQKKDGKIYERDHINHRPLALKTDEELKSTYNSAGAGCFAKPVEYCQIIATLLNDGVSPTTNNQILKKETVDEMFKNQIPQFPNFGRQGIPNPKPDYSNALPDIYPQPAEQPQGWGLTFMITIHPGATGRGANTAFWAGLPNLFWWADREKGIGGIIASQIVPFGDMDILTLWFGAETAVYSNLK